MNRKSLVLKTALIVFILNTVSINPSQAQNYINLYSFNILGEYSCGGDSTTAKESVFFLEFFADSTYNDTADYFVLTSNFDDGTFSVDSTLGSAGALPGPVLINYDIWHDYYYEGIYHPVFIIRAPDGVTDTVYFTIYVTYECGNIRGTTFRDNNSNCVFDSTDNILKYCPVKLLDSLGNFLTANFSNEFGQYYFSMPNGFSCQVQVDSNTNTGLVTTCPSGGTFSLTASTTPIYNDFGYDCFISAFDLGCYGTWNRFFVPGDTSYISVFAGNLSCQSTSGILKMTLGPQLTYAGFTLDGLAPTSVIGDTLIWNLDSLYISAGSVPIYEWLNEFSVVVPVVTDTTATLGDSLCINFSITPIAGDINTTNNTSDFCDMVNSSFDPNFKGVMPVGQGPLGIVPPDTYFKYTVHFQNTGTIAADNIYIWDELDNDLDFSTLEIIASSHEMIPSVLGDSVKFNFANINLPDSATSQFYSQGWVEYRIKAKSGLALGTSITNTAYIYFDYNPAVVTNTTLNTIDLASSINSHNENNNSLKVYPNPAGDQISVVASGKNYGIAYLIDFSGRIIETIKINSTGITNLNIEKYSNGIYQIIVPGDTVQKTKLVIIR